VRVPRTDLDEFVAAGATGRTEWVGNHSDLTVSRNDIDHAVRRADEADIAALLRELADVVTRLAHALEKDA
jgi:hypothetical protein